jgi:hypothetical protein
LPAEAVILPTEAVILVDTVKLPVIAVLPVTLPILTAPVPPVPIVVAAAPVVLIVVVPASEIGPGVTVKAANVPIPPDAYNIIQLYRPPTTLDIKYITLGIVAVLNHC